MGGPHEIALCRRRVPSSVKVDAFHFIPLKILYFFKGSQKTATPLSRKKTPPALFFYLVFMCNFLTGHYWSMPSCPLCFPSPCTWGRTLSPCLKKSTCANDSSHPRAPRNPPLLSTILSTSHLIVDFTTILTSGPNRRRPRPQNKIYRNIVTIRSIIFTFSCWHGHCLREGTRRKHSPLTNADNGPEQSGNHTLI